MAKHSRGIRRPKWRTFQPFGRAYLIVSIAWLPATPTRPEGWQSRPLALDLMSYVFAFSEFYKLFAHLHDLRVIRDRKYS